MKNLLLFLTCAFFALCRADTDFARCSKIHAQKDTNWTKLVGAWYHHMYIPGASNAFLNCRRLQISKVNETTKSLDFTFKGISYERFGKKAREDSVSFNWDHDSGVIHQIKHKRFGTHSSSKLFQNKKTLHHDKVKKWPMLRMVATDYTNYIILLKCRERAKSIMWISLKSTSIGHTIAEEIRKDLAAAGLNAKELVINNEGTCSH